MFRRTPFLTAVLVFSLWRLLSAAQQSPTNSNDALPSSDKHAPSARQSAMNMLEEVLAGTGSLELPQNRLAIELQAFPTVWTRSEPRARALINQMAGEFAAASTANSQRLDQNPNILRTQLRQQRVSMARAIGRTDAGLALVFLSATLPYVESNLPDDDPEDHALVVDLAAQIALHDPHRSLQLAEQQLKESVDLPPSFNDLLQEVQRSDAQAGARLFSDVVDQLKQQNLAEDTAQLTFAISLLGNQFDLQSETGHASDGPLHALAEVVASAVLTSNILQEQPFILNQASSALDALLPAKSAALRPPSQAPGPAFVLSPETKFWRAFNQAQPSGDFDKALAMISNIPEDDREEVQQRVAWTFANNGDLQRTQQLAANIDPWQRNNIMQQAIRSAALAAGSRADFAGARQLAAQITDEESRAMLLSDLAIYANGAGKRKLAEELLGEATALVMNRTAGSSAFAAQLTVARAYLCVNPAQAVPLLERSASQLEQAISAAAQLDGFLPDRHSFEGSELILNEGFLYQSLIEPYAEVAAELATVDLAAARSLADRLPLPEARLMTELFVADGVLDNDTNNDKRDNDKLGSDKSAKNAQAQTTRRLPLGEAVIFNTLR